MDLMAHSMPRHCREEGFTLTELLVTILIISILAAIAIPAFLDAAGQANDAPAKEMARTAQTTGETLGLDNGGSYATVRKATLHSYESTIATTSARTDAYLSAASGTTTTYTLTVTSVASANKFTIARRADGTVVRTCTIPKRTSPHGGCANVKGTTGSW